MARASVGIPRGLLGVIMFTHIPLCAIFDSFNIQLMIAVVVTQNFNACIAAIDNNNTIMWIYKYFSIFLFISFS